MNAKYQESATDPVTETGDWKANKRRLWWSEGIEEFKAR
jgi:hypothetical protein